MGTPYLTPQTIAPYSAMPSSDVAALDAAEPGFIKARIAVRTSEIHARLGKRYAWPFASPTPEIVNGWLGALVTVDMYIKRGVNSQDTTIDTIKTAHDLAESQMKEAADAKDGLFELPLREDLPGSGVSRGGPLGYSETSPWTAFDQQACAGRREDRNR